MPSAGGPVFLAADRDACISEDACESVDAFTSPLDIGDYASIDYHSISLQECISFALQNSKIFRDLGGNVIRTPESVRDVFGPADVYSDPRFSEEAALAAFDASFVGSVLSQKNDRPANLSFQGTNGILQQDAIQFLGGFQKLAATGTFFALRHGVNYDFNNQTGRIFEAQSWESILEGEVRHPLLQGGGALFNRIAGPSREPGVYSGVLIARTNTEITLLEFQKGVRDLISEVENAYWDLYFSYRNLEANIAGRNKAYEVFKQSEAAAEGGRESTQAVAQAREQYQRFRAVVLDAMEGRPGGGTRNFNGSSSGVFQSAGGVRVNERKLRLLIGMPINGPQLLKPSEEPTIAGTQFDWQNSVSEAFQNREELLQQKWRIKQKELELVASKNFLQPRLDLIGQYRMRGLGQDLLGGSTTFQEQANDATRTSTAYGDLLGRDFQEWQMGAEISVPIGYRRAHLGVKNAELSVARERALYREQKREVVYGLSNAIAEMRRAYTALKANEERFIAAKEFQHVMKIEAERGRDRDIELEAQRRVVESEIQYRQSQVEYALAIKAVHVEKGTFLEYCNVRLSESVSDSKVSADIAERESRMGGPMSYLCQTPTIGYQKSDAASGEIVATEAVPTMMAPTMMAPMIMGSESMPLENLAVPMGSQPTQPVPAIEPIQPTTMVPPQGQLVLPPNSTQFSPPRFVQPKEAVQAAQNYVPGGGIVPPVQNAVRSSNRRQPTVPVITPVKSTSSVPGVSTAVPPIKQKQRHQGYTPSPANTVTTKIAPVVEIKSETGELALGATPIQNSTLLNDQPEIVEVVTNRNRNRNWQQPSARRSLTNVQTSPGQQASVEPGMAVNPFVVPGSNVLLNSPTFLKGVQTGNQVPTLRVNLPTKAASGSGLRKGPQQVDTDITPLIRTPQKAIVTSTMTNERVTPSDRMATLSNELRGQSSRRLNNIVTPSDSAPTSQKAGGIVMPKTDAAVTPSVSGIVNPTSQK